MYVNENEVATTYDVDTEIIRGWVKTNYISGAKKKGETYEIVKE